MTAPAATATLRLQVYTSPTREIPASRGTATFSPTTSTLIAGAAESVLVDTQFLAEDVDALGDMVAASATTLTAIFVTHAHPDHAFGAGRLLERFPAARVVATRAVADATAATLPRELNAARRLFGDDVVDPTVLPAALGDDLLRLEGHELRAVDVGQGDIAPTAVLHVPSLDAVVAGDVVYNRIHPMMAFTGPADWTRWGESVDAIAALSPRTVVAGHKDPNASNEDIGGMLGGTRAYLRDFAEAVAAAGDVTDVVARMRDRYPDYGNVTTLHASAGAAVGKRAA